MENILNKDSVLRVQKKLDEYNKNLKAVVLNSSARTAKEAAESLKTEVGSIVKSLLFKTEDSFVLCLVSGDKRCSLNKLKKIKNQKDICMANAEQVKKVTGFTIGGVSPVGHINEMEIYIDNELSRFKYVYAAAGHPNCIFKIDFDNLINITKGSIKNITE
tara:strand:+ start:1705 stop:2187 length:483 start_codon:yes stop_codon:yes gene_type:complete